MSNHLHIVLKLRPEQADLWTESDALEHWTSLYKGSKLIQHLIQGDRLYKAEQDAADLCIEEYKKRLKDLGWFMKALNEPIARGTNKEDGVLDTSGVGFCSCKIDTPYIYVGQSIYINPKLY